MLYNAFAHTKQQLDDLLRNDRVALVYAQMNLLESFNSSGYTDKIVISPPVFVGGTGGNIEADLMRLKSRGYNSLLVHTLDTAELGSRLGFRLHGGFRMNVTNNVSALKYEELGLSDIMLSVELSLKRAERISCTIPKGIVVYGKIPLMATRRCPISDGKTCGGKNSECEKALIDRKGNIIPVLCDNCAYILNPYTLNLSDKIDDFVLFDFGVFYFTDEKDVNGVINSYLRGEAPDKNFTRGLYYK